MSIAICPHCSAPIEPLNPDSTVVLSCRACGWNCAFARRAYKNELLSRGTIFILALFVFHLRSALLPSYEAPVLVAMALVVVLSAYFMSWKAFSGPQTFAAKDAYGGFGNNSNSAGSFVRLIPTGQEADELFSTISSVPKPRPIRWGGSLRIAVVLLSLITLLVVWIAYSVLDQGIDAGDARVVAVFLLCLGLVICIPVMPEFRRSRLLKAGEATVGRVVCKQRMVRGRRSSISSIHYAFIDRAGQPFMGAGRDFTVKLQEGAPVVVFYAGHDPNHNVALESCRSRVKLPS
jgi:hypothetical protein